MIVVTGGAGFIGSCFIRKLIDEGFNDIVVVDDFSRRQKNKNLSGKNLSKKIDREKFFDWLDQNHKFVQFVFHIGARTDTTEFDVKVFDKLNLNYSKSVWKKCSDYGIPLVYASSAATYGAGENGYDDQHELIADLKPLNPYGNSKNDFDKWALAQSKSPYFWIGLKFFNVYGPNEYHKGRMASVIFHAYRQVIENDKIKLFKSHKPDFGDGEQKRDFIYVTDVIDILFFLMHNRKPEISGIYNVGTAKAETFNTLAKGLFKALDKTENIEYVDTPEDIREKYQYFTEAKMNKLRSIGYKKEFVPLGEGIRDYVMNYLKNNNYY